MKFNTILVILFATIIIFFSLQNSEVTDVKFLFWKISTSRVIVILGSFVIGLFVGALLSMKKPNRKKYY